MKSELNYVPFSEAVDICDTLRKPINKTERRKRIEGKNKSELYPYYGATGLAGYIDDYITDGEYVLLGEDGAPFLNPFASKAYIIRGKSWVNNHAHVLRSKTNNAFLCYYLNHFNYKGYVSGTTRLKLTQTEMKKIPVPNPPFSEQERIVSRIEELFSQLDAGEKTLKTTKEELEVYQQAVLKDAFSNCSSVSLSEITEHVTDGDHMPPPKASTGVPFIMISNVKNNKIVWTNTAFVGREYYDNIDIRRKPVKGDILYTVTGSFGIPVLIDFDAEFCFQRHIALIRPNSLVLQKYLYYAMMSPDVFSQASKVATGTAQKTVGLTVLRKIKIPFIDDIRSQQCIVDTVEKKMSMCDSIKSAVDTTLLQSRAMRQSILKDAFEGRL